jgi:homoserine trans-succinylase
MEKRTPMPNDQEKANEAFELLQSLVLQNPQIESTIWIGGCWSALVDVYIRNGMTYTQFCKELDGVKKHYKRWWERDR